MSVGEKEKRITYLFDVLNDMNGKYVEFWVKLPEFQDAICERMDRHENITREVLLTDMVSIRDRYRAAEANGQKVLFNFNLARRAINKLSKELGVYEGPNRKGCP